MCAHTLTFSYSDLIRENLAFNRSALHPKQLGDHLTAKQQV